MSENKNGNKKISPVIYGLAVIAVVIGSLIFKPTGEAPATQPTDETVSSSLTEIITTVSSVSLTEETTVQVTTQITETETATSEIAEAEPAVTEYYFRNQSVLDSHYEKHGIEMGFASAEEYEAAASAVINSPDALYKTEKEDGDGVYYIEATNEFAVLSTDGYIRTYFLPSAGKAYFERQ